MIHLLAFLFPFTTHKKRELQMFNDTIQPIRLTKYSSTAFLILEFSLRKECRLQNLRLLDELLQTLTLQAHFQNTLVFFQQILAYCSQFNLIIFRRMYDPDFYLI
jgi:hypothetical protein